MTQPLPLAKSGQTIVNLLPAMANRHGLITGATGTGKTVTMQRMAEQFSAIGVPVFMADIKGDLTGMAAAGVETPKLKARLAALAVTDWQGRKNPVVMWDIYGKAGHPLRATISDMGPLLLSRILNLNDTQESVLQMVFKIADDEGLLLIDLKDLRAMLQFVGEHIQEVSTKYGLVSAASIGAIQRGLLTLETQGGDKFFGEPMLNIADLMQTGAGETSGRGVINIMAADQLMKSPALYSIFLLWLLAELFEQLPEVGDVDKPKLVFFFDEAHLLFAEAPAQLLTKIEQVVRLIRSKGVGVYFVTQNPLDVPQTVLAQLSNRVQHALRAFTPSDQKAVKTAAATLRANPKFDAEKVISELEVGEALVSFLDEKGAPQVVERAMVLPPFSRIGPLSSTELQELIASSPIAGFYEKEVDRLSAFERLQAAQNQVASNSDNKPAASNASSAGNAEGDSAGGQGLLSSLGKMLGSTTGPRGGHYPGMMETAAKSAARAIGSQVGRQIIRGVLGSILGGRR